MGKGPSNPSFYQMENWKLDQERQHVLGNVGGGRFLFGKKKNV